MADPLPQGFEFVERPSDYDAADSLVVRIPSGLIRKRDLLNAFAQGLKFPGYFGWNWDAFEDLLKDLSWIKQPRRIVVVHESLPFQPDWENRDIYLSILRSVVSSWKANDPHEVVCVFPERFRGELDQSH